jgi:hypothetical protein
MLKIQSWFFRCQEAEIARLSAAGAKERRRLLAVPAELCVVRRGSSWRLHRGAQQLPSVLHRREEGRVAEKLRRKSGSNVYASKVGGELHAVGSDLILTQLQCSTCATAQTHAKRGGYIGRRGSRKVAVYSSKTTGARVSAGNVTEVTVRAEEIETHYEVPCWIN